MYTIYQSMATPSISYIHIFQTTEGNLKTKSTISSHSSVAVYGKHEKKKTKMHLQYGTHAKSQFAY